MEHHLYSYKQVKGTGKVFCSCGFKITLKKKENTSAVAFAYHRKHQQTCKAEAMAEGIKETLSIGKEEAL
jgi:hypothetical protein